MGGARARSGLGFGLGSAVIGNESSVKMSSGTRLTSDVWVGSPPSAGRGFGTRTSDNDDAFFSLADEVAQVEQGRILLRVRVRDTLQIRRPQRILAARPTPGLCRIALARAWWPMKLP